MFEQCDNCGDCYIYGGRGYPINGLCRHCRQQAMRDELNEKVSNTHTVIQLIIVFILVLMLGAINI